jgi:hypothetical protein
MASGREDLFGEIRGGLDVAGWRGGRAVMAEWANPRIEKERKRSARLFSAGFRGISVLYYKETSSSQPS